MRGLAVALLVATTLAGCMAEEPAPSAGSNAYSEGDFEVTIVFDDRNVFYAGDPVQLVASAAGNVGYEWDLGDGTIIQGADVEHAYGLPGSYDVRVVATRSDGAVANAGLTIAIQDLYGPPIEPGPGAPGGDDSGIINVTLVGDEPVAGGIARLVINGPSIYSDAGTWTIWVGDTAYTANITSLPEAMSIPMPEAGRQELLWHATLGDADYMGKAVFDVWGIPIEFGEPTSQQWLRPGVHSEVCTINFLFHYKWYRFFVGSAAHCIDSLEMSQVCKAAATGRIGDKETLSAHSASLKTSDAWVAYNSWLTMYEHGGADCGGNDFALIELGPEAQKFMHPKAMGFGGPTAMAPIGGYGAGTTLYGYGASNLHGNVGTSYPGQPAVNSKRGISLGTDSGGYSQHLYFAIPGVPGDSGGPAFGPGGQALGAASTITLAPTTGSNHYTIIPKALEYMQEKEGWAPELMTYATWSSTGA